MNVAGIGLGVGVFLAIQIANRGALESFRSSVELTTGRSHLEIRGDLDENLLPAIASVPGVQVAAPLVEGIAPLIEPRGEYLRIAGVDPFAGAGIHAFRLTGVAGKNLDIEAWLRDPAAVATSPEQAARMRDWGTNLEVLGGGGRRPVRAVFEMISDSPRARAEPRLAAMDIAWAQELLGLQGRLTSVQILLDDESRAEEVSAAISRIVPPDVRVAPPAGRNEEMRAMLGAFHLNLTAMSLVSLVVGMFLVFNSVSASVVRRQTQIAILRAAGASRLEIRWLFLGEAFIEAAAGAALGILLAPRLAGAVSTPVAATISSLYEVVRIDSFALTPGQIVLGFAVGFAAALAAAALPAHEASRIEPARILHPGAPADVFAPHGATWALGAAACLAPAFGASWFALAGGPKLLGFVSAGLVVAGFSLLVPWFTAATAAAGRPAGLIGRLAADHLSRSLHRNGITIAALAAAVSMSVAVTVMIHSFRASVAGWIDRTLTADMYIAPAANELGGLQSFLPEGTEEWARVHPAVKDVATFRELTVRYGEEPVSLAVFSGAARGQLEFLPGSAPGAQGVLDAGAAVAVSESFVSRFGLVDVLMIPSPSGPLRLPVCGVYRDFTRERGTILMPRILFEKSWNDPRLHSLAISVVEPSAVAGLTRDFRARFGSEGQLAIYDNAALRNRVIEIFEQTFAVTAALRGIAILVAVTGIAFSLSILATERAREIGVLRALGASRAQVLGVFLGEAGLLGLASAFCGVAGGAVLAMVLTWVVNKAFFGWSIALSYPLAPLALTPLWIVLVAVGAAIVPAWKAASTSPAKAVRFE